MNGGSRQGLVPWRLLPGLGLEELREEERLFFSDLSRPIDGPTVVSGDYDLFGLVHRLEAAVAERRVEAVVIDSATSLPLAGAIVR